MCSFALIFFCLYITMSTDGFFLNRFWGLAQLSVYWDFFCLSSPALWVMTSLMATLQKKGQQEEVNSSTAPTSTSSTVLHWPLSTVLHWPLSTMLRYPLSPIYTTISTAHYVVGKKLCMLHPDMTICDCTANCTASLHSRRHPAVGTPRTCVLPAG